MPPNLTLLQTAYKHLPISNSLKRFMSIQQFNTLEELLKFPLADLLKMKWFNMHSFMELYNLLKSEGLEHELKSS